MKTKMKADYDLIITFDQHMAYVMNHVRGTAFGHLEPHAQDNATQPQKNSNEMLVYLQLVFGDSNRQKNAKNNFQALSQGNLDFVISWAEFQWLSIELN